MTKEELKHIIDLDRRIDSKIRQLESLKQMQGSLSAIDYSKDKVQTSVTSSLENSVVKIVDLQIEINRDIDELVDIKNEARMLINEVKGIEGTVLEMRYLECMKWEEIAYRLTYSIQHVYRLHGEGLLFISKGSIS